MASWIPIFGKPVSTTGYPWGGTMLDTPERTGARFSIFLFLGYLLAAGALNVDVHRFILVHVLAGK